MFIYNVKVSKTKIFKIILAVCAIICFAIFFVSIFKILGDMKFENNMPKDYLPKTEVAQITAENYTNILKMVNEDLDTYIGQKISFVGYVYRVNDIKENQFILARDMLISDNPKQTLVVGFLAEHIDANLYENNAWVKVSGSIEKGYYFGEVPVLKIDSIEKVAKPEKVEVPMPDDYYVPTAVIY